MDTYNQPTAIGQLLTRLDATSSLQRTERQKSQAALMVIDKYGEYLNFEVTFAPKKQAQYALQKERCFMGKAPVLGLMAQAYGESKAEAWLEDHIWDLSEYSGCKDKLTIAQIEEIAKTIRVEFGYMKVTEIMYFFHLFKAGRYGKFYGAVDGLVITCALQEFARDRYDYITRLQQEAEKATKAKEEARHEEEVRKFRTALSVSNMSIKEWLSLKDYDLTLDDVAEIGWLFRLGYEPEQIKRDSKSGPLKKVRDFVGKLLK